MAKSKKGSVNRRGFLKGAAAGAAALVTNVHSAEAQRGGRGGAGAGEGAATGRGRAPARRRVVRRRARSTVLGRI